MKNNSNNSINKAAHIILQMQYTEGIEIGWHPSFYPVPAILARENVVDIGGVHVVVAVAAAASFCYLSRFSFVDFAKFGSY